MNELEHLTALEKAKGMGALNGPKVFTTEEEALTVAKALETEGFGAILRTGNMITISDQQRELLGYWRLSDETPRISAEKTSVSQQSQNLQNTGETSRERDAKGK